MVVAAGLALPATGSAARPRAVQQGYGAVNGAAVGFRSAVQPARSGSLPFTGVDLGLVAAGGGGLLLLGGALKRAGDRR
jgi:hypothetical protein